MAKDRAAADKSEEIEFWFEFGSTYSYLSVMRIEDLAARCGIRVNWQPFLLGPIFQSFGWNTSPFVVQKEKGEYVQKDMARQCRKYGIPWKMPTHHTAGITHDSRNNMRSWNAHQVIGLLRGERPLRLVNPHAWPRFAQRFERIFGVLPPS
jgi:2-hydroxychromene-2-carboxylate isomerase